MTGTSSAVRAASARPSSGGRLQRLREVYREHGAFELLKRAAFQVFKYDWQVIYALGGRNEPARFPAELEKLMARVRSAVRIEVLERPEPEVLHSYLAHRRDLSAEEVAAWLHEGHVAVIIRRGERIIGDGWLAVHRFPVPDPALARLLERGGYGFSFLARVDADFQGIGVFPLLVFEQMRLMREKGKTRLLGTVERTNVLSMRSVEKMGFRRAGTLHLCWVLGGKLGRARWDDSL
jgi:hypothetical protein